MVLIKSDVKWLVKGRSEIITIRVGLGARALERLPAC